MEAEKTEVPSTGMLFRWLVFEPKVRPTNAPVFYPGSAPHGQKHAHRIFADANTRNSPEVKMEACRSAIQITIMQPSNGVIDVFWNQFYKDRGLKHLFRGLLLSASGDAMESANRRGLLVLEEHGFIIENEGKYRFRIPLFEAWLRRYEGF